MPGHFFLIPIWISRMRLILSSLTARARPRSLRLTPAAAAFALAIGRGDLLLDLPVQPALLTADALFAPLATMLGAASASFAFSRCAALATTTSRWRPQPRLPHLTYRPGRWWFSLPQQSALCSAYTGKSGKPGPEPDFSGTRSVGFRFFREYFGC
jgi:hypothetical protein